jgi:hypothetical protein
MSFSLLSLVTFALLRGDGFDEAFRDSQRLAVCEQRFFNTNLRSRRPRYIGTETACLAYFLLQNDWESPRALEYRGMPAILSTTPNFSKNSSSFLYMLYDDTYTN